MATATKMNGDKWIVLDDDGVQHVHFAKTGDDAAAVLASFAEAYAEPSAADLLAGAKASAVVQVAAALEAFAAAPLAKYRAWEIASWRRQSEAARAYDADGDLAPADMLAVIDVAISLTAETRASFVASVLAKEAEFSGLAMVLRSIRAKAEADIGDATDLAGVQSALDTALATLAAV